MRIVTRRNVVLLVVLVLLLGTVIEETSTGRLTRFATGVVNLPTGSVQLSAPPPVSRSANDRANVSAANAGGAGSVAAVLPNSEVASGADISNAPSAAALETAVDQTSSLRASDTASGSGSSGRQTGAVGAVRLGSINPFVSSLLTQLGGASGSGTDSEKAVRLVFGGSSGAGVTATASLDLVTADNPDSLTHFASGPSGPGGQTGAAPYGQPTFVVDDVVRSELNHSALSDRDRAEDPQALSAGVILNASTDRPREDVVEFVSTHYGSEQANPASSEGLLRAELARANDDSGLGNSVVTNPEPQTLILLGSGLLGLVFWHRANGRRFGRAAR